MSDVRPGIIIQEDVFANTKYPIIKKNTTLEAEHIIFLEAFGIHFVKISEDESVVTRDEPSEDDKLAVDPDTLINTKIEQVESIQVKYNRSVENYKKEFTSWRAGVKPDITKVRSIIIPLLEAFEKKPKMLRHLNELSSQKDYYGHHALATGILASAISRKLNLPEGQVLQIGLAGALADCGMAKVNMSIIEKPAFLTKEEFIEIKKHVIHSYQMIKDTPFLRPEMKLAILQHHERLDGSGYPSGLKYGDISVWSQIIAVADVFHAMTCERQYRAKESPYKVLEMINEEEFGKFDIKVVQALKELVGNITIGAKVILTNGQTGEVIFVHRDSSLRPMVRLDYDKQEVIDLSVNRAVAIEKVLSDY